LPHTRRLGMLILVQILFPICSQQWAFAVSSCYACISICIQQLEALEMLVEAAVDGELTSLNLKDYRCQGWWWVGLSTRTRAWTCSDKLSLQTTTWALAVLMVNFTPARWHCLSGHVGELRIVPFESWLRVPRYMLSIYLSQKRVKQQYESKCCAG
jgi:hypothetical protein